MNGRSFPPRIFGYALLLAGLVHLAGELQAQAPVKRPLTHRDYEIWNTTSGMAFSKDGRWLAYNLLPGDGDGLVIVKNLATGAESRLPQGRSAPASNQTATSSTPEVPPSAPTKTASGVSAGKLTFSPDVKRLLVSLTPTRAEVEKARNGKVKPGEEPQVVLAVYDLAGGKILRRLPTAKSYTVGGEGAGYVIYHKAPKSPQISREGTTSKPTTKLVPAGPKLLPSNPPAPPATPVTGTDLVIHDLATGQEHTVASVSEYVLSKDGKTLVYTVFSSRPEDNGVFSLDPASPRAGTTVLRAGRGKYSRLTWSEKQHRLAFFADEPPAPSTAANVAPAPRLVPGQTVTVGPAAPPKWRVFLWDRAGHPRAAGSKLTATTSPLASAVAATDANPAVEVLAPESPGFRKGWMIVDRGGLSFSEDETKLFVSTASASVLPAPRTTSGSPNINGNATRPDDSVLLDIWHWKDGYIQPMQKVRAESDRTRSYRSVILLDENNRFRQLSDANLDVSPPPTGDWALAGDDRAYRKLIGYGAGLRDVSLVNVRTGEQKSLARAVGSAVILSPDARQAATFDGTQWIAYSLPEGRKINLTEKLPVKFFNEDWDSPSEPPAYGIFGWTKEGNALFVRDRYDVWKLPVDGSPAVNLTQVGRASRIEFRLLPQTTEEDVENETEQRKGFDLAKPLFLAAEDKSTYDTGFYRLEPDQTLHKLAMQPRKFGVPLKARNANLYLFTASTFFDAPDYYVSGPEFNDARKVTEINPRTKEFNWGKAELVRYKSADGVPLTGMLVKPENFDPSRKYPLMVYIYERLSENLHTFRLPSAGTSINPTYYASNGYLVLMPDITYTIGSPGQSALKCVLPAIQAVVDQGSVNETAIGIQGHSWGGYQISYMVTQTNRFKAAVAGAPVSNMVSAYGGIRWGTGLPREFQYERTQSRIGATLWQAPMKFIENSPIFMADRVRTPLLILHNDQDDAVPWYQGIEYYLALRRLEREVYLLNYNGELHGLRKKANQRDYTLRMQQFFDHHLKGAPAPEWMVKGVPYLERENEKLQWSSQFDPKKPKP